MGRPSHGRLTAEPSAAAAVRFLHPTNPHLTDGAFPSCVAGHLAAKYPNPTDASPPSTFPNTSNRRPVGLSRQLAADVCEISQWRFRAGGIKRVRYRTDDLARPCHCRDQYRPL